MTGIHDKLKDIKIAYFGGGSLHWAYELMHDLALNDKFEGTVSLYDIDIPAAERNRTYGNSLSNNPKTKSSWKYEVSPTLEEALTGAHFVIISILPATFEEMKVDVHLPEEYGILQPVGDTVGPGGLLRALRTIPYYIEFAEAIKAFAPNAWVINYTNPMSICVNTLYTVFPEIKAFGCCHEVFNTQKMLAAMVEELLGVKNIKREEIKVNVLGINHFTWFDEAYYRSENLFPLYNKFVDKYYESGFEGLEPWNINIFSCAHRVKFDLFKRFKMIASAGDRHLVEFIPEKYLKDKETVLGWKFSLTAIKDRIQRQEKRLVEIQNAVSGSVPLPLEQSDEEGVRLIQALLGLGNFVTNANLPNKGQMPGLKKNAIVETNALFMNDNIHPVIAGTLPPEIDTITARHSENQTLIVQAGIKKDTGLALQALTNDPLVILDNNKAEEMFFKMLRGIQKYLPGWNIRAD